MSNVIWKPQPKQAEFMRRKEFEVLYGGAAGGGKSDALIIEALRQVNIPHYKCLILRKTFPQLRELIDKSINYYPKICPNAKFNSSSHTWTFPSGAKIIFGSMNRPADKIQYQGQAYDVVMFDELTHFTYEEYIYLFSRCRPNGPGTQCYVRATCNPGNVGHGWVKERFVTAAPPMTTIWEEQEWVDPDGNHHTAKQDRVFVPSSVFDNPALLQNDPQYVQRLASMPEAERNALLYGDWDTFSGQVFTEWKNDPKHYEDHLWTHVVEPFEVPAGWTIWCGMDWGYSRPFSVGWYAVEPKKRGRDCKMYRIREYYGCTGTPNTGIKKEPAEVARKIREIESDDPNLKGRTIHRVGDPAIWGSQTGESIGALMERERVYFEKGEHARIDGKMQCHHRLAFNEDGETMFQVFSTCKHFIRTVPALVYDESDVEDIDTDGEDHCLAGSTEVWTTEGKKLICDMINTEGSVISSDGQPHRYHDVRLTQRDAEVFQITLEDGSTVTATKNHRFRMADGSWKRLDHLREGYELLCISGSGLAITSIAPAGRADVYNMEVEDAHDFAVGPGIIAHNCYDEWRYVCMKNPISAPVRKRPEPKPYNPLDTDDFQTNDRYEFYRRY